MYDPHAQTLQKRALDALSDLRAWLWAQHGHLFPNDVASVSREHAQRYAAYLEWFSKIEDALVALDVAGQGLKITLAPTEPALAERLERKTLRLATPRPSAAPTVVAPQPVALQPVASQPAAPPSTQSLPCPPRTDSDACPPTVRSATAPSSLARSVSSHPMISILAPMSGQHAA